MATEERITSLFIVNIMTVNENLTDGISLLFQNLIPGSIQQLMIPPLVYFVACAIGIIVFSTIWLFLVPEQDNEYPQDYLEEEEF